MKVELLSVTPYAKELLIYTKQTRLQGLQDIGSVIAKSDEWKDEQLDYMKKTIQSSFEFVNYVFKISDVTRSFTHQLVRSRHNSYAQESMRAVDVRDHGYRNEAGDRKAEFDSGVSFVMGLYEGMVDHGVPIQDAREILPTGIHTSIIVGANLRSLSDMASLRLCTRTAGEYQEVFKEMKQQVLNVHPWAEDFLQVACVKTGICIFPNYKECPVQEFTLNVKGQYPSILETIKIAHNSTNHVADPSIRK